MRKYQLDPIDLQRMNSFLGFSLRASHPSSYRSLLGHVSGHTMIDPEETLLAMRKSLNLLKKVTFRGGRTLFVSTQPMLKRLTRVVGQQSGQFFLATRWVPGVLTNWEKGRGFVRRRLALDPRVATAGRLKNIDLQKANNYRGVEAMTRPPDLIVVLDNTNLLGEPNKLNIPVRAGAPPSARQLPCGARHGRAPALHVAPSSQSLPERPSPAHAARFSRAHAPRRHRDTPTTPIRRRPLSPRSPRRQHAKVVGVVDTDSPQEGIDYPIIANTKSLRFYHTFAHMLVRTIKEGQQLRDDLDKYEIEPPPAPRDGGRDGRREYRRR